MFTSAGVFIASTVAGEYADNILISGSLDGEEYSLGVHVAVLPGSLDTVIVSPPQITVEAGGVVNLTLTAVDRFGNEVTGTLTAASIGGIGEIESDGTFVASVNASMNSQVVIGTVSDGTVELEIIVDIEILLRRVRRDKDSRHARLRGSRIDR